MRVYRLAKGFWQFSFGKSPGGWHLGLLKWILTTEPE